jgi:hypothetical protein
MGVVESSVSPVAGSPQKPRKQQKGSSFCASPMDLPPLRITDRYAGGPRDVPSGM